MTDDRDDRRRGGSDDRGGPDDRRDPEDLDERVAELEGRVRELRDELGRPPEGPLGLPRPPTPREVLSFTGEYAIPTAIAVLEANIRALKALQQVVRVLDPDRSVVDEERDRLESRAADASRATLDRLESALADVETTIRESDLPRDDEARDVLEDARRINREIRDRVSRGENAVDEARDRAREADRERTRTEDRERASGGERDREPADGRESGRAREDSRDSDDDLPGGTTIELTDEGETGSDGESDAKSEDADDRAEVDVEAELRSIKEEIQDRKEAENTGPANAESDSPNAESDPENAENASGENDSEESGADESDATSESSDDGGASESADSPSDDEE